MRNRTFSDISQTAGQHCLRVQPECIDITGDISRRLLSGHFKRIHFIIFLLKNYDVTSIFSNTNNIKSFNSRDSGT